MTTNCSAWYKSHPHEFQWMKKDTSSTDMYIYDPEYIGICVFCGGRVSKDEVDEYFSEVQVAQRNKVLQNKIFSKAYMDMCLDPTFIIDYEEEKV